MRAAADMVRLYTDGACAGNPGPGGWGVVMLWRNHRRCLSGGEPCTTNNRMELKAAIEGLGALKKPCRVALYTDSQYLRQGITSWIEQWQRKGWRTAANKAVKNEDLWRQLQENLARHEASWHWVKGHNGDPHNEEADRLARLGMKPFLAAAGLPPL